MGGVSGNAAHRVPLTTAPGLGQSRTGAGGQDSVKGNLPASDSADQGSPAPLEFDAMPSATGRHAVCISGCTGKYKLINDTYELMPMKHQDKPCWCARSTAPVYLFHTGKARWVISKRINDGARCYAFVTDDTNGDPSSCKGPWMCCGDDGNWSPDPNIRCTVVEASTDQFVQLRLHVEEDLRKFGLMENKNLKQLWRKLDANGNNVASLAEIDSLIVDLTKTGVWPDWVNHKPAIMRAYEKTVKLDSSRGDDFVEKEEFHGLLLNIFWFAHLHQIFQQIDTNEDNRLDFKEFSIGMDKLGIKLTQDDAEKEFRSIDQDDGGMILFVEFCAYVRRRIHPEHNAQFDADIVAGERSMGETVRKKHGDKATHSHFLNRKSLSNFDDLERRLKALVADPEQLKKLWEKLDFNGNCIVSLAEVDKLVVSCYPLLNHKPALMRAYQSTIRSGEGEDWVEKADFKLLLCNIFYFNRLFWMFDQVDEDKDRRLDFKEFKWFLAMCGFKLSEAKCQAEFRKVDVNGGGIILFDEFCRYFTDKVCPESLTEWVEPQAA